MMILTGLLHVSTATDVRPDGLNWIIENTRLRIDVQVKPGRLTVTDKTANVVHRQLEAINNGFTDIEKTDDGLAFTVKLWTKGQPAPVRVTLAAPEGTADLSITADMADRSTKIDSLWFLPAFVPDRPNLAVALADYSNGHLYPADLDPFPGRWNSADRLDLPLIGVIDPDAGCGYALIIESSDDAVVECHPYKVDGKTIAAPRVEWKPSMGTFSYPRRLIYRFLADGGHVAVAKAYRAYAKDRGLLVTLAEKARANPNVRLLYGATDVWGGSFEMAKQAHAAGVDRMLLQGDFRTDAIRELTSIGYLTGQYDNYTDVKPIEPGKGVDSNNDLVPEHVVLKDDGERMKAWLTYDKKTQFMKRCPLFWLPAAEVVFDRVLKEKPYPSRFIDVTSAEALYECHDPAHPLTRGQKRACGEQLLAWSTNTKHLVTGGEHGIWWAAPHVAYIEGMMSHNPSFAWPAGHLKRPAAKDEKYDVGVNTWAAYDRDGIGAQTRIPLWELVFHDCVVSTWYWGDSSDFLVQIDAENWDRKDAFNVLYGTMPMLWANRNSGWAVDRDRCLRTMKVVGAVHRAVAEADLLRHEWITPDRSVQKCVFSNGVETIANLGSESYEANLGGRTFNLPPNGYAAVGPDLTVAWCENNDGTSHAVVETNKNGESRP
jgi:hypothetical protein